MYFGRASKDIRITSCMHTAGGRERQRERESGAVRIKDSHHNSMNFAYMPRCCRPLCQVAYASEAFLMYETDAFRSGIVAMLLLLPIVLPMRFSFFHKRVSWQSGPNSLR